MAIKQVIPASIVDNPSGSENAGAFGSTNSWQGSDIGNSNLVAADGNITRLVVVVDVDPATTASRTYTLHKAATGSTSFSSTGVAVTINSGETSDVWTGSVAVSAGESLVMKHTDANGPAAVTWSKWCITFEPTTDDQYSICDCGAPGNALHATATEYLNACPSVDKEWNATAVLYYTVFPAAGTVRDLYVELNDAPGAGTDYTFTLEDSAASAYISATVANTAVNGNSGASSASISAGDVVIIKCVPTGTPTARFARICFVFEPTTADDHVLLSEVSNRPEDSEYNAVGGGVFPWTATEAQRSVPLGEDVTLSKLYAYLDVAPGAGDSRTFTLMVDTVASSGVVAVVNDAEQQDNSGASTEDVSQDSLVSVRHTEITPANSFRNSWSLVCSPQAAVGGGGITAGSLSLMGVGI